MIPATLHLLSRGPTGRTEGKEAAQEVSDGSILTACGFCNIGKTWKWFGNLRKKYESKGKKRGGGRWVGRGWPAKLAKVSRRNSGAVLYGQTA